MIAKLAPWFHVLVDSKVGPVTARWLHPSFTTATGKDVSTAIGKLVEACHLTAEQKGELQIHLPFHPFTWHGILFTPLDEIYVGSDYGIRVWRDDVTSDWVASHPTLHCRGATPIAALDDLLRLTLRAYRIAVTDDLQEQEQLNTERDFWSSL